MRVFGALLASLVLGVVVLHGQSTIPGQPTVQPGQPAAPQRTPARPLRPGEAPPKGNAVMKGQVLAAGTGTPVRRAQVRVMSMEGRGGGVTNTDAEGYFEIRDLPAGRYNVSATKNGYVMGSFGQRRPGEPGTPIELAENQIAEKVNFQLSRGGVISGRIVDDGGEPLASTQVSAMRYAFMAGGRRLVPAGGEGSTDRTDDQGGFRLYGLPPGEYYVSANNRNNQFMMAGVNSTETEGYAPTYFPGTPNISEATRVAVKAGQETSGANFALMVARMARIRGRAISSNGEPVAGAMVLMNNVDSGFGAGMSMMNAVVGADGNFQVANIAPGRYQLTLRPQSMGGPNSEFGNVRLTVGNEDIDNLIVTTSAGATAKGVVITDDGSVPSFRADQVQIFAQPAEPMMNMMGGMPPKVNEDYTFELSGLFERRLIRSMAGAGANVGANTGWFLKAVLFDGQDVTDHGIDFTPGRTYEGIQVVFTRKTTDLSGLVSDDRNRPVLDATVVIFPADREKWLYSSRYIRSARPDTNGRYNIRSMPPADDYMIIAVQGLESGQGADPDFLARALEEAKAFSLADGETKALDLKLSRLVP